MAWFTYISKRQSNFAILVKIYFHELKFCENKTMAKMSEFTVFKETRIDLVGLDA